MKSGTVALVIARNEEKSPVLVESLSDDHEIAVLESAISKGSESPLKSIYQWRGEQRAEEEQFADYVEDMLCQPFLSVEMRKHGLQWFESRIKIEKFKRAEVEAAQVIAGFAFKVFLENPSSTDFFLVGPTAKVRIRVLLVDAKEKAEVA